MLNKAATRFGMTTLAFVVLSLAACGESDPGAPLVEVTVTPDVVTLGAAGIQTFTASVANAGNSAVTWTASAGNITGSGNSISYKAPAQGGAVTLTAVSVASPERTGAASITVTPVALNVVATNPLLLRGQPTTVTVTVTGTDSTGVTWTASCGIITGSGATVSYSAPDVPGVCKVIARSSIDVLKSDTADIVVQPDLVVSSLDDVDDGACTATHCSLREAINAANSGATDGIIWVGLPPGAAGRQLYPPSAAPIGPGTLVLTSPLPTITITFG